ncbi:hypothetical protein C8R46DRAFT_1239360 [Mycena filopes]|nr:hypothetical protein C8R46DRAFT_1239360 [Mycena filopes]
MSYKDDIVPSVIREAGRAVADRILLESRRRDRRDYDHDDYDRRRSRSPRPYDSSSSSGRSYDTYNTDNSHRQRGAHSDRGYPRDSSPPRPAPYWTRPADDNRGKLGQREGNGQKGSKYRPQTAPRPVHYRREIFPPDTRLALYDPSGHPIFPPKEAALDDTIHGTDAGLMLPLGYAENEDERRSKALELEAAGHKFGKVTTTLTPENAGVWSSAGPVMTFDQAVNVVRWVHRGNIFAREYLRAMVTRLGTNPTLGRSLGEVTLLQHQNQAMAVCKSVIHGYKLSRNKVANAGSSGAYTSIVPQSTGTPEAKASLANAATATDTDVDMTPPKQAHPVYLGTARRVEPDATRVYLAENPPKEDMARYGTTASIDNAVRWYANATRVYLAENPPKEDMARYGTTASIDNAVRWYANVPTSHWPRGMRVSYSALPSTATASPWPADVGAWFTLNALAPARDAEFSSIQRAAWMNVAVRLLSIHGTFDRYVEVGSFVYNTLPLEHYPFEATNVSFAQVISWLTVHGIETGSTALSSLESFARARRNHAAPRALRTSTP